MKLVNYKDCECTVVFGRDNLDNNIILLEERGTGKIVARVCSTAGMKLGDNQLAITLSKDTEGLEKALQDAEIIENVPLFTFQSGTNYVPVYKLKQPKGDNHDRKSSGNKSGSQERNKTNRQNKG